MRVSVVIPVYNVENYLRDCLDSVVNQTLDNIEIICINDGSTDNSLSILYEYRKKYDNIKVIDQENKGLGFTRNVGIELAKGEYIYFLDSDDYIELDAMEICYNEAKSNNLDILSFDAECVWDNLPKGNYSKEEYDRYDLEYLGVIEGREYYIKSKKINKYAIAVWFNFYNTKFIKDNNLFFEDILFEDIIHTPKSFSKAKRVKYIKNKLYNRRVRLNSITTSSLNKKKIISYINLTKYLIKECINKINGYDLELKYFLDREIYYSLGRAILGYQFILDKDNLNNEFIEIMNNNYIQNDIRSELFVNNINLYYSSYNYSPKDLLLSKDYELKMIKSPKIYYISIPEYKSILEQATVYSTTKFLKESYPNYEIVMFNNRETDEYIKDIKSTFKNGDFVVINYNKLEDYHIYKKEEFLLDSLSDIPIVFFTGSINSLSEEMLNEIVIYYSRYKDKLLFLSDEKLYNDVKNTVNLDVFFSLNMILYLNNKVKIRYNSLKRNQIMTYFSYDKEDNSKLEDKENIIKYLRKYFSVFNYKIEVNQNIYERNLEREDNLYNLWDEYYKSKVVITDTLHGMMFAVITKTPCIVLRNLYNKKVESCKLLDDINYIKYVDYIDSENIYDLIKELSIIDKFDEFNFDDYFNYVKNIIDSKIYN